MPKPITKSGGKTSKPAKAKDRKAEAAQDPSRQMTESRSDAISPHYDSEVRRV